MQKLLSDRCCALLLWAALLFIPGISQAAAPLYEWRSEIGRVRMLAENDVPLAYKEAQRLQANQPADAPIADQVRVLNLLARIEAYLALTGQSEKHVARALKLAEQQGDRVGQAEAQLIDILNSVNQAKFDNLLSAATRSVELLDGVNNPALLGEAMLRLSMTYRQFGYLKDSIGVAMDALIIAKRSNNPLALTYAYQGLCVSYQLGGRYRDARENCLKMRDYAAVAPSKLLKAQALQNLSLAADKLDDVVEGERLMRDALDLFRATGAPLSSNSGRYGLADILHNHGRDADAMPLWDKVIAIYEQYRNPIGLMDSLNGRSKSLLALGRLAAARSDIEQAHAIARQIGLPFYLIESAKSMAALAAVEGDHRQASRYYAEAIEVAEMAGRKKVESRMVELVQRYRTESEQRWTQESNSQHEQHIQRQRLLQVLLGCSVLMLLGTLFFMRRLRCSREEVRILNGGLELRIATLLQQRGTEFHRLADNEPDPIFRYDRDCRCLYFSPAAERLCEKTASVLLGKTPVEVEFSPEGEGVKIQASLLRVLKTGLPAEIETRYETPSGEMRYFHNIHIPEFGLKSEVAGVLSICRDISERKRYEAEREIAQTQLEKQNAELQAYKEKLEQRVVERTAGLIASNQLLRDEIGERKQIERNLEELRTQLRGLIAHREEVREEERKYIARELHDEVGQIMTVLKLSVQILAGQIEKIAPSLSDKVQETTALTSKAIDVVRDISSALRPVELDMGIVPALEWAVAHFVTFANIQCKVNIEDREIQIDEGRSITLYRIAQESLTNISKHAMASKADISLSKNGDDYVLKVRDNGVGFDTSQQKENSFGLVGIRERVLMLGGEVFINSSPGRGTEIIVRIPAGGKND